MKVITFRNYQHPNLASRFTRDRKYHFWIPGKTFYFGSERKCLAFMAETSRFFSDKFIELNDLYGEIFTMWRGLWLYDLGADERRIVESINTIELYMNRAHNYGTSHDNSLPVRALLTVCDTMVQTCELMRQQHDKRSSTALKKKARSFQIRAISIKYQFENYKGPDELTIPDEYLIEQELEAANI